MAYKQMNMKEKNIYSLIKTGDMNINTIKI